MVNVFSLPFCRNPLLTGLSLPPADWPRDIAAARRVQEAGAERVLLQDNLEQVNCIAGVDCGFEDGGTITRAAVVVLSWPRLERLDQAICRQKTLFPYIPGYLSFRELPAVLSAFRQLVVRPQLIFCDGQGFAHPRRFGIACHLGIVLDQPTIGVGKSRLVGTYREPGDRRGCHTALRDKKTLIGRVVRTRDRVRPLFISGGHRISHLTATRWVLKTARTFRLPEPIRSADRIASRR